MDIHDGEIDVAAPSCPSPSPASSSSTACVYPSSAASDLSLLDSRNKWSESAVGCKHEGTACDSKAKSIKFVIQENGLRTMPTADDDDDDGVVSQAQATNQQGASPDGLCIEETKQDSIHRSSKCDHQATPSLHISTEAYKPKKHASLQFSLSAPPLRYNDDDPVCGNHADDEIPSSSPASLSEANITDLTHSSSANILSGRSHSRTLQRSCSNYVDVGDKKGEICMETDRNKEKANDKETFHTLRGKTMSTKKQKKLMRRLATINRNGTVEFDAEGSARFGRDLLFGHELETREEASPIVDEDEERTIQPLQIAMLIVGTRGDVQPFVAIGKHLQEYGHRVRLATHSNFEEFVLTAGLEFYPLGGDPKVLAGYMVKNKGVLPSGPSEIKTQRKQLKSIINSLLRACTEPHKNGYSFRAQAIIANPPTYGHVHVAEALKIPVHIFFTMPWTPTSEFPHPLARVHHTAANRLSYQVVDAFIWWGIRDIINEFRKKKLKLRPITYLSGSQISVSKLPTGYIWSPHLVPKPKDWGPQIDVVGFCFLNLAQDYKPPESLVKFLAAGPPPIYVGFGSMPVEDPQGVTEIIVKALKETNHRGIIDKGWGGIGSLKAPSDSIYLLENCPHDWLFPRCAAVVHHGGAGTTAAGLRAACPTTIVPFFGDQPFWGDRVHAKGVGPAPIPVGQFCFDKLVDAINYMMRSEVKQMAMELAEAMKHEDGVSGAVKAFHRHLPRHTSESITKSSKADSKQASWHKICSCFGAGQPL